MNFFHPEHSCWAQGDEAGGMGNYHYAQVIMSIIFKTLWEWAWPIYYKTYMPFPALAMPFVENFAWYFPHMQWRKMSPIMTSCPFSKWDLNVLGFLLVVEDNDYKWYGYHTKPTSLLEKNLPTIFFFGGGGVCITPPHPLAKGLQDSIKTFGFHP